jgi:hypothetical protein
MIAWRVGWVVAPGELANDVSRVQIYNGLVASGPVARPAGAWSLLLDVGALGARLRRGLRSPPRAEDRRDADARLGRRDRRSSRTLVFSNEPVDRLALLGPRVRAALATTDVRA